MKEKEIVICDIDGTVANNDHRQHYLEGKKDWDGFFSELINDKPIYPVIQKVCEFQSQGKKIIFLTGRPERYSYSTTLWLKEYFDFDFELLMRGDKDKRNKLLVKEEIFKKNLSYKKIFCVIDNDISLLDMWRELKLEVIDVSNI
tara:strand:+ start:150 stop:584 length:435 start_codon:yes stop_codon:yes gene_type:complete